LIKLTDKDGDPIYIKNDVVAIYTGSEKVSISSFHQAEPVRTAKSGECRGVVSASSGGWFVRESYEEILAKIAEASECE
jgi:hypothetical protein